MCFPEKRRNFHIKFAKITEVALAIFVGLGMEGLGLKKYAAVSLTGLIPLTYLSAANIYYALKDKKIISEAKRKISVQKTA